ncbi:MAG: hypothetical protein Q9181_001023 [Wetmoreana brouardii]
MAEMDFITHSSGINGIRDCDQDRWLMLPSFDRHVKKMRLRHAIETHCERAEVQGVDGEHMEQPWMWSGDWRVVDWKSLPHFFFLFDPELPHGQLAVSSMTTYPKSALGTGTGYTRQYNHQASGELDQQLQSDSSDGVRGTVLGILVIGSTFHRSLGCVEQAFRSSFLCGHVFMRDLKRLSNIVGSSEHGRWDQRNDGLEECRSTTLCISDVGDLNTVPTSMLGPILTTVTGFLQ